MVVSNYPYWPRILKQVGGLLGVLFLLSVLSLLLDRQHHMLRYIKIPDVLVSILGAALSILLAFRTNSAYARWWEARTLWGALVNNSRSIARQAITFPRRSGSHILQEASAAFSQSFVKRQIAFVHAMRCALRGQAPWDDIAPYLDAESLEALKTVRNVPAAILQEMGQQLTAAVDQHVLSEWHMHRIDTTLSDLSNILGGCERIKNTPLPRQYDFYPELLIKIYCVALPFVIVDEVGIFTPVITLVVSFAFLVLNRIGKNLEDPFENRPYDVPMTALSRTIEINLKQALQMSPVPDPVVAVDGVLM
ncbi:MAG TPA: bestrophin family ion channel [Bryobacteraceae bacterium]|jgi:putative membrane protein|nr:bestrophin family ion channel [Bryobacteraceae bacterium]